MNKTTTPFEAWDKLPPGTLIHIKARGLRLIKLVPGVVPEKGAGAVVDLRTGDVRHITEYIGLQQTDKPLAEQVEFTGRIDEVFRHVR